LAVIRALVASRVPMPAAEVARATGIPAPTVTRLLATLADEHMAVRSVDGAWGPGPGLSDLVGTEGEVVAMIARAPQVLRELADATGETALLTRVRLPDMAEVIVQEDSDRLLGVADWTGRVFDPRNSVAGWIWAAALTQIEVEAMAGDDDVRPAFLAGVEAARRNGYGLDIDGLEDGLTLLAVAIAGPVPGMAVGLTGPSSRLTPDRVDEAVVALRHAATRLLDDH
jgi:IclR family acetate operon transcriptional repressor